MLVDEFLSDFGVSDRDVSDAFWALVIDELKHIDKVVAILVTLPEYLQGFHHHQGRRHISAMMPSIFTSSIDHHFLANTTTSIKRQSKRSAHYVW